MSKPDLTAVLAAYDVEVRDAHGWQPVRCPVHGDRNASASVNLDYQRFRCHACDAHGDAWELIMLMEGCPLPTAKKIGESYPSGVPAESKTVRNTGHKYTPQGRRGRMQ